MKMMASSPIISGQIDGETMETVTDFIFLGSKITANVDCTHEIKTLAPWKKSYDQPRQHIKKQRHCFADKGPSSQSYGFSSSHLWTWVLDHKESWAPKNWCFWTVVLEKTLESPLDCKEIQPVHTKGYQSWIFIQRTDSETKAPILWPPDAKKWLMWKYPDAGKDWRQEEKGMTEDEMVGWHHWLNGHEFEQAPGVGDGQGSLACCSPWGHKELDMTEQLNSTQLNSELIRSPPPIYSWNSRTWTSLRYTDNIFNTVKKNPSGKQLFSPNTWDSYYIFLDNFHFKYSDKYPNLELGIYCHLAQTKRQKAVPSDRWKN